MRWQSFALIQRERAVLFHHGQAGERGNGINAAGAEQNETRFVPFAQFEHVERRREIMIEHLATADLAVHTREHAGIGRRIDDPIKCRQSVHVRGGAEIGVENFYAAPFEFMPIGFAARPGKIIETEKRRGSTGELLILQSASDGGTDEPANSGDENFHWSQIQFAVIVFTHSMADAFSGQRRVQNQWPNKEITPQKILGRRLST